MPWNGVTPIVEKMVFVSECLRQSDTVSGLCQR